MAFIDEQEAVSHAEAETTDPAALDPDIVAVVGDEVITQDRLAEEYLRSAAVAEVDSTETYRAFLDRYVDYRLKVHAARDAGRASHHAGRR